VMLAQMRDDGSFCAVKILRKANILRQKQLEHIISEKTLLAQIRHPFIVCMRGCFMDRVNVYMVMEYVVGGELFTYLSNYNNFTKDMVLFYAAEMLLVLEYLHNRQIVYRDLKPENVLIDAEGHVKITDFGFAKRLDTMACFGRDQAKTYTVCGTMDYLAPEIIKKQGHGYGVDYWALGVIIFEMLAGYPPFDDDNPIGVCTKILNGDAVYPDYFDGDTHDIIRGLLTDDLQHRLGCRPRRCDDIKDHPFFAKVNWEDAAIRGLRPPFRPKVCSEDDTSNFPAYDEDATLSEGDSEDALLDATIEAKFKSFETL